MHEGDGVLDLVRDWVLRGLRSESCLVTTLFSFFSYYVIYWLVVVVGI